MSTRPSSGPDLPAVSASKVDVNAIPVYKPVGKPITQVSIDEGLSHTHPTFLFAHFIDIAF